MKKKNTVLILTSLLVVMLVVGGTMAWFTATAEPVENKFKAGTVKIKLIDKFDEEAAQNVNPGDCYDKEVYVKSSGTKKTQVRIKQEAFFEGGLPTEGVVKYEIDPIWELKDDGFYYYKMILEEGVETARFFVDNKVCFDGANMGNEYQGKLFTIKFEAEAIQATNGAPTAAGWKLDILGAQ